MKNSLILLTTLILLPGCSNEESNPAPVTKDKLPIFNEQINALEKAKGIEAALQATDDKRRLAIAEEAK